MYRRMVSCITADACLSLLQANHEWFGTEFPAFFSSMKGSKQTSSFFLSLNVLELNSERFPFSQADETPKEN
jgi:hypothetical protein